MKANPTKSFSTSKKKPRRGAQQRSRQRAQTIQLIAILGALAGLVVLVIFLNSNGRAGASANIEGVQVFTNLDRSHTTQAVNYAQIPPAGGPHHPIWQNCGVYTQPVTNEHAVHSLEHGVVWITYHPDLDTGQLEELQEITRQSSYRLLSPYPDLPAPIVLSAWGYQLQLEQVDDPRLMAFIEKYEQNPLGPEPGASCAGGIGTPG